MRSHFTMSEERMSNKQPKIVILTLGQLQTNCYLVICQETFSAIAIDPADQASDILEAAARNGARIEKILLTHAHMDHLSGLPALLHATNAPLLVHRAEIEAFDSYLRMFGLRPGQIPPLNPDVLLEGGEELEIGQLVGRVLHTPGHAPGAISLVVGDSVFTGDTLFAHGVGRVDLPGGDPGSLMDSVQLLLSLPEHIEVYPGHGSSTTIAAEKAGNPYA